MSDKWFVIYTRSEPYCGWCVKLKQLLSVYGYDYYERDISEDRFKAEFLKQGFNKVPQVFLVDDKQSILEAKHIGGYENTKDYLRRNFFTGHPNQDEIIKQLEELE
ncbi:MAG: hypothetical protein DI556_19280 [Rhodovulum sulfidophilum]|uniref:Glutaredoxin domain-containing protein n=1 Tax=Rhodovulum sulfidophilum TaxID=35806 RepID=A0A2W5N7P8_RHOSU|nr:MAG: hypothetical protein DI556_19280 [Rhodovulum sulfidophilum]